MNEFFFFFVCFLKTQVIRRNIGITCEVIERNKILYIYIFFSFIAIKISLCFEIRGKLSLKKKNNTVNIFETIKITLQNQYRGDKLNHTYGCVYKQRFRNVNSEITQFFRNGKSILSFPPGHATFQEIVQRLSTFGGKATETRR